MGQKSRKFLPERPLINYGKEASTILKKKSGCAMVTKLERNEDKEAFGAKLRLLLLKANTAGKG